MKGGLKNTKNFIKLMVFGLICVAGVVAVGLATRWFFFNFDVLPMNG